MLAIIVLDVVRMERERGGQEVCDLREARSRGLVDGSCDEDLVIFGSGGAVGVSSSSSKSLTIHGWGGSAVNEYNDRSCDSVIVRT